MIRFDDIRVTYGDAVAIPNLDLTINEGEFFTLLGPSGCGKTTALRTLAGFIEPTGGRVLVADRDVTRLSPDKREIGMVFQNYALFPSMSVRDNIGFGLSVKRVPKSEIEGRVTELADAVQLTTDQLDKSVAELSGGQQQRVAIARALITKPKILLLDEPLSNLDAQLRHQLRQQLKELQAQFGITTVYVTHDQEEALTLSDRIAVMRQGRIEQVGSPQEIYHHAATEFVCTFIGEVNAIPAREHARISESASHETAAYVRVEQPAIATVGSHVPGTAFDGTVVSRSFHGLYTSYRVDLGSWTVKVVADGRSDVLFAPGDAVTVGITRDQLLTYRRAS